MLMNLWSFGLFVHRHRSFGLFINKGGERSRLLNTVVQLSESGVYVCMYVHEYVYIEIGMQLSESYMYVCMYVHECIYRHRSFRLSI